MYYFLHQTNIQIVLFLYDYIFNNINIFYMIYKQNIILNLIFINSSYIKLPH